MEVKGDALVVEMRVSARTCKENAQEAYSKYTGKPASTFVLEVEQHDSGRTGIWNLQENES